MTNTPYADELYEILESAVHSGLEEGRNGDLDRWYKEYDGDDDWTAFVAKNFPIAAEAKAAITAAMDEKILGELLKVHDTIETTAMKKMSAADALTVVTEYVKARIQAQERKSDE